MSDSGVRLAAVLNSPAALEKWKTNPLGCFEGAGISLKDLSPQAKQTLTKHLISADPNLVPSAANCILCKAEVLTIIGGLEFGTLFVLGILDAATEGADTPALPAQVEAALGIMARAIAAALGLTEAAVMTAITGAITAFWTFILVNRFKALAMFAAGTLVTVLYNDIAGRVCKLAGKCG